ncbi:MAG: threonine aldolase family protein [Traorella sp.]
MIQFQCDYAEGCHPNILKRLVETNDLQSVGYGEDEICESARNRIKKALGREDVDVHFLVGGTQANLTVIDSILRSHQGVISAKSGHINVHETGAIEACGHKVLALESKDGTIHGKQVKEYVENHYHDDAFEHIVQPGMVYISFPTENGTLYSKKQLEELYQVCQEYDLPLFIDGARLGYGLMSPENDLTIQDITNLCDIFYIGGTKVGALFGEAVVISNPKLKKDFRYFIKQKGGMLAKGRLLGIQFDELFKDDLYFKISKHAIQLALKIKQACIEQHLPLAFESYTNQQFILLTDKQVEKLEQNFILSHIARQENYQIIRICTSWTTKEENVDKLIQELRNL